MLVPVVAAAAVFDGSTALTPTYESSTSFRVTVPNSSGLNDTVISAANDLATQYAQLVTASPVVEAAAHKLDTPAPELRKALKGSTVNGQNLVQVTAQATTAADAERRATATTAELRQYIDNQNVDQSDTYGSNVSKGLGPLDKQIARYTQRVRNAKTDNRASLNAVLSSLLIQRQQIVGGVAQTVAAGRPALQGVSTASAGTKKSPQPLLYALVALFVTGLISARIAFVMLGRSSPRI